MTWGEALESINYLAAVGGVLISIIVGFLWYSPKLFGGEWAKLVGLKNKDKQTREEMTVLTTTTVVFYFLASVVVAALVEMTQQFGALNGMLLGAVVGFVFGFGPLTVTYAYARRKFELTLIDGAYIVVTLSLIGLLIGWWQ